MAPKTAKDMFVEQTFIDDRYPPIALKVVSEAKFELGLLQWLLPLPSSSSDSKVTVGMHAGFSKAGFITALALSVSAKVLMITDLSARSRHDDSGGGMRRHLHSVLLNDTSFRITSFIAPELVLALHREIALRCVHVVDLLSLPPGNRDIVQTIKSAFGARIELYDDTSLREAFQENLYDKQQQIILAQKAWLAYFVGDCPEVKTQLSAFPIIDSTVFSINELNILAKAMLGLTAYELAKPNSETIKSLGHADFSGNNVTFNQASYSKRFRKSSHQVYRTSLDGNVTLTGFLSTLNGRQAKLAISDLDGLSNPVIESITILGKADPSHAEKEIYITILYCLQRKTLLLNDPWMDMLFPSFASTDDDQTNPSSDHDSEASLTQENSDCWAPVSVDVDPWATAIPGRKILHYSLLSMQPTEKVAFEGNLNQSQSDAVEDMLNLNRQISIIKGPPGTGKTTVIAAFVANILSGSDKTVWIAAQNNVAVKNIGEKLLTARITDWVLLVSAEYLVGW
ncbi:hypothetical protein EW145_g3424 [Phellinidium pouzarii]|uniref:DNA2/NAM7 helicase helicase domain-containing protein n=1 Tax=Phellinidium pouzarii TaxID=167371 RepID=A0A4S4LCG9_9AGAM|nr:hypothetical protein EW145_g3424 [Phellinidium pouzarii]